MEYFLSSSRSVTPSRRDGRQRINSFHISHWKTVANWLEMGTFESPKMVLICSIEVYMSSDSEIDIWDNLACFPLCLAANLVIQDDRLSRVGLTLIALTARLRYDWWIRHNIFSRCKVRRKLNVQLNSIIYRSVGWTAIFIL